MCSSQQNVNLLTSPLPGTQNMYGKHLEINDVQRTTKNSALINTYNILIGQF